MTDNSNGNKVDFQLGGSTSSSEDSIPDFMQKQSTSSKLENDNGSTVAELPTSLKYYN